jgi:hypothetical protein
MYCITLRNKSDETIVGWYDGSASNFSTDQRRAKVFVDRDDADLVANQLRRQYQPGCRSLTYPPGVLA